MKTLIKLLLLAIILVAIKSINLLNLPLYLDEGIYIFWAKLMRESANFAYVSLQDGKTPLFMWIVSYIYPLFKEYLLTGRLISVAGAGITFFSWAIIINRIFPKKEYLWFWVLMIVCPYTYLVERLAFTDSLLVVFGSLSLMMSIIARDTIVSHNKWLKFIIPSLVSGLFLSLAFMTKSSATLFVLGQLLVSLCWTIEQVFSKQFKKALFIIVSFLITFLTYSEFVSYLRVGAYRFWGMIQVKESVLTFPISKIFTSPDMALYKIHSVFLFNYAFIYFGTLLVFIILGLFYILKNQRKHLWLVVYAGVIIFGIFLSGKVIASRYFYMAVPSVLAIGTIGILKLREMKRFKGKILTTILLMVAFYYSLLIVFVPMKAKYARDDQGYFVSGDISALGLAESIDYINEKQSPSVVGVVGIWGVVEGSVVAFEDAGINAFKIDNLNQDQLNRILGKVEEDKYLYLTGDDVNLDTIKKYFDFSIEKTYFRPHSNLPVYLLKIQ